jgi:hypothetical protein
LPLVQEHFDAFVTIDQGFEFEHNLKKLKIRLGIVDVSSNKLESYRGLAKELRVALAARVKSLVTPGSQAKAPPPRLRINNLRR